MLTDEYGAARKLNIPLDKLKKMRNLGSGPAYENTKYGVMYNVNDLHLYNKTKNNEDYFCNS